MTPVGTIGNGKSSNCGSAERQVRQNVKKKKEIEKKTSDLFSKSHQNLKVSIGKKILLFMFPVSVLMCISAQSFK